MNGRLASANSVEFDPQADIGSNGGSTMLYRVAFQYRPKDKDRPYDHEQSFDVTGGDERNEFLLIPNIGDHVFLPKEDGEKGDQGVVENRSFFYERSRAGVWCLINIVITDSDVSVGKLMKS